MTPVYDTTTLPNITYPFTNQKEATRKYLGGRALTGEEYMTINIVMVDNAEALVLFNFWETTCNYGTIPFLVALPLFGMTYNTTLPTTMCQFYEDISMEKSDTSWKQTIKVKILGEVDYVVNDALDYLVDDSGNYIISDLVPNSNKEITWA